MTGITTLVLDVTLGKPAAGIRVQLFEQSSDGWVMLAESLTDIEGRCKNLGVHALAGTYKLSFLVNSYFAELNRKALFPLVDVTFEVTDNRHYHLPLLLSENSYTTCRGS
jgi:5-hydroxyisourate hydrolase